MKKTLTRASLVVAISKVMGKPQMETRQYVEALLDLMVQDIKQSGSLMISGFGTFVIHKKAPRKGRNPQTGERLMLEGRTVVTFKVSRKFRDALNSDDELSLNC